MTVEHSYSQLFQRVEKARRRPARIVGGNITLAHGSGGKAMHELIEGLIIAELHNPWLALKEDQAVFEFGPQRMAFTTDSFVVDPIFFPGGDIGTLAVNGTVNDLAMSGARPLYLSAGLILEEGLPIEDLRRIIRSMKTAALAAGVEIVTGDTKVVQRGGVDKIFINTAGIGVIDRPVRVSATNARVGDKVIVSGTIGDHGSTIMIARGELALESNIESDSRPLNGLVREMLNTAESVDALGTIHCLRDPTRGGLATTLNEIALSSDLAIRIYEDLLPIKPSVKGSCEILGLDPLYVANEGIFVAIVSADIAERLISCLRQQQYGQDAVIIGEVAALPAGIVTMATSFGGTRIVDMLIGEQLPRIC